MKICPKCNTKIPDKHSFCPQCGQKLTEENTGATQQTITFMTSLWCFIIKSLCGKISFEKNAINFSKPNTVLSIIAFGSASESIPINQISSVESDFSLSLKELIIGIIITIIGLDSFKASIPFGLIFTIGGASIIINAFQCVLAIHTTSGNSKYISFIIFEKSKMKPIEQNINQLISNRLNDTNTREQTEAMIASNREQTEAMVASNREQTEAMVASNREQTEAMVASNREQTEAMVASNREQTEAVREQTKAMREQNKAIVDAINKASSKS